MDVQNSLTKEWGNLVELYPEIDGMYLLWEEYFFFINPKSDYGKQSRVRENIKRWKEKLPAEKNPFEDRWEILDAENVNALNCAVLRGNCIFGVWISADKFLDFFQENGESAGKKVQFLKKEEAEQQKEICSRKYFMITEYFTGENFGLSLLIEKENIFRSVRPVLWIFLSLSAVGLLILVVYMRFLYKAIKKIEDLDHEIYEEKI